MLLAGLSLELAAVEATLGSPDAAVQVLLLLQAARKPVSRKIAQPRE